MHTARVELADLDPAFVIVDPAFAVQLTTHHTRRFECEALETAGGAEELTRDIPNVGEEALAGLDDAGVIRVGTIVRPGSILIGKVTPRAGAILSREEKLLRVIFGDKAGDVLDASLRAPPGCAGTVAEAELDVSGKSASVLIEWTRPLEVGDVLELDSIHTRVAAIRSIGADIAWAAGVRSARVVKMERARDVIHARSIGPYDRITHQALEGRERFGGQRLEREAMRVLAACAPWAAWEALTLRSDHVNGRVRAYEAIVKGEDPAPPLTHSVASTADIFSLFESVPQPGPGVALAFVPEVIRWIGAHLLGLGFFVDFHAEIVGAELLDGAELRRRSRGAVASDTLFDQRIFGPIEDYRCACGKYSRMKHRGVVCETCGVDVIDSRVRRERFAHLELAEPCVHPCFLTEVGTLLELSEAELSQLPGAELRERLARLDLEAIDAIEVGPRAELAVSLFDHGVDPTTFLIDAVAVLPPDLRPERSELDRSYAAILEARNRADLRAALNATYALLGEEVDRAWRSSVFSKPLDYSGVAHVVVDPKLDGRSCRVPRAMLNELFKPWAYALLEERGYVTTIKSAKKMVEQERIQAINAIDETSAGYPLLLAAGTALVVRTATAWDAPAIAVDPHTARILSARAISVHVPLTFGAAIEYAKLADLPFAPATSSGGWLSATMGAQDLLGAVRRAALMREREWIGPGLLSAALGRPPPAPSEQALEEWREARSAARSAFRATLPEPATEARDAPNAHLMRLVDELELSVRTANALARAQIRTVGELCTRTESEILKAGFDRRSLKELKEILAELGLSFGLRA